MRTTLLGGAVCKEPLAARLLPADPRQMSRDELDRLWKIFVAIGIAWRNTVHGSAGLKSSWLEFVDQKTTVRPSYVAEYDNALAVADELVARYGTQAAFTKLFFDNGIPREVADGRPVVNLDTRLAHAKHFVVDEFIRVQIVAGGFKQFIEPEPPAMRADHIVNYNGFVAGSRFNRVIPVRSYVPPAPAP